MELISLFAGAGGLDKGFQNAGFKIPWANEFDKSIWETYIFNHSGVYLDKRCITEIPFSDIPCEFDGIIGGPPCQSWSLAGAMRGANDDRGKLFFDYIKILENKQPKFFLVENVPGLISKAHKGCFLTLIELLKDSNYNVTYEILNAKEFGVPQERRRVFVIGYRKDLNIHFDFSSLPIVKQKLTLKDAISDLPEPYPAKEKNIANANLPIPNHEYMVGGFSSIYMSRNRKRNWDEPSFTIQAGGRHAPLHPDSAPMIKLGKDKWKFDENTKYPYRRLSVRECARVQTFPDGFVFKYKNVADGYKMVGNAVPVELAIVLATKIKEDLMGRNNQQVLYNFNLKGQSTINA